MLLLLRAKLFNGYKNKTVDLICPQFKTLFLLLALVSCLISINCASLNQHHSSVNQQQKPVHWSREPIYSLSQAVDESTPSVARQNDLLLELINRQLDSAYSYNTLNVNQQNNDLYSAPLSTSDWSGQQQQQQRPVSSQYILDYPSSEFSFGQTDYDLSKLHEDLLRDKFAEQEKDDRLPSINNQQQADENDFLALLQYTNSKKQPTYQFKPLESQHSIDYDQSSALKVDGDIHDQLNKRHDSVLKTTTTDNSHTRSNGNSKTEALKTDEGKLTTLLEDEDVDGSDKSEDQVKDENTDEQTDKTDQAHHEAQETTTVSYGTLTKSASSDEPKQKAILTSEGSSLTSVFNQMYKNLAHYLPFLTNLQHRPTASTTTTDTIVSTKSSSPPTSSSSSSSGIGKHEPKQASATTSLPLSGKRDQKAMTLQTVGKDNQSGEAKQATTKQAFSTLAESNISKSSGSTDDGFSGSDNFSDGKSKADTKSEELASEETSLLERALIDLEDDQERGQNMESGEVVNHQSATSAGIVGPTNVKHEADHQFAGKANKKDQPAGLSSLTSRGFEINVMDPQQQSASNNIRLRADNMRHSPNLILPYTSRDEFNYDDPGQYVYSPSHQTTNKLDMSNNFGMDDQQQHIPYSPVPNPFVRRLHPGDDVYGSYRTVYPQHPALIATDSNPGSFVANKSNDIYFLVMVGAFCVMAMAVVLAAGLFAYRVQQNRKSNTETDYPTYGVVGPNNMNGKCGAASFVGGYFGSMGGPGSNSTIGSGKAGSMKHLPDVYSNSDSGVVTTSCGNKGSISKRSLNEQTSNAASRSGDFMASQNVARMYHYQHQKQQMIISDRASTGRHTSASDLDSEEENDDGSYTVYECPGLASAHEMEIKNPLFNDDQTP